MIAGEAFERALAEASDELGLQPWYRDCVRPIVKADRARWPRCCDGGCEPCNDLLKRVASRVLEKLEQG